MLLRIRAGTAARTGIAFYREVLADGHVFLVARQSAQVLGWCDVLPVCGEARAHVGTLGIGRLPAARHLGFGARLLRIAIDAAWARGFTLIELGVRAENARAIALYRRFGFVPAAPGLSSRWEPVRRPPDCAVRSESYTVVLKKDGFADKTVNIESALSGWYTGNFLFGGLIGLLAVDPATGGMYAFPDAVSGTLEPRATRSSSSADGLTLVSTESLSAEQMKHARLVATAR